MLACAQRNAHRAASSAHHAVDKASGAVVERLTEVWPAPSWRSQGFDGWRGLVRTFVRTTVTTHCHGSIESQFVRWHAATAVITATQAAGLVRGHWGIENRLHRQRDLVQREDACHATGSVACGLARLRTQASNLVARSGRRVGKALQERWHNPEWLMADLRLNIWS